MKEETKKRKQRLLVDMDGVCVALSQYWFDIYNSETGDNLTFDMVEVWELSSYAKYPDKMSEILNRPDFFYNAPPNKDAIEYFSKLIEENKFRINILTQAPINSVTAVHDKRRWMEKYFPKFNIHNMIFAHNKFLVSGDFLLDDHPHHLLSWKKEDPSNRISVAFDYKYNRMVDVDYRVSSWKEFYSLVNEQLA